MDIAAKLDDLGKPAWIGLMVLGFILFWPVGLAVLGYLVWSGRLSCGSGNGTSEMGKARGRWYGPCGGKRRRKADSSGNSAFDEYRDETLRRLEEEQQQFMEFLERLRHAKDKAEFDQFMAERRNRPEAPAPEADDGAEPRPRD